MQEPEQSKAVAPPGQCSGYLGLWNDLSADLLAQESLGGDSSLLLPWWGWGWRLSWDCLQASLTGQGVALAPSWDSPEDPGGTSVSRASICGEEAWVPGCAAGQPQRSHGAMLALPPERRPILRPREGNRAPLLVGGV